MDDVASFRMKYPRRSATLCRGLTEDEFLGVAVLVEWDIRFSCNTRGISKCNGIHNRVCASVNRTWPWCVFTYWHNFFIIDALSSIINTSKLIDTLIIVIRSIYSWKIFMKFNTFHVFQMVHSNLCIKFNTK